MIPNVSIKPNTNNTNSIIGSRAYTFLDSYVYMKNQRYNALYEKNKEILAIENNAISIKSANILYNAFMEEARILDSIVIRIRNFALRIKPDIIENINILIPSMNAINDFDNAISMTPNIPKYKYIHYNISPIMYENMASFINLYKMEINAFTAINTQSVNKDNPFIRDKATQYLIEIAKERSNVNKEMLEMEQIKIINPGRLKNISKFFRHKNQYISTINNDFKTFQFYLRQYSGLREITSLMKPTELRNGDVLLSGSSKAISFNDYFVLYKHFHAMIKYMISIISYHEQQFFNKIYGLQSNIESYVNIVNEVLDYAEKMNRNKSEEDESLNESSNDEYMSKIVELYDSMSGYDYGYKNLPDNIKPEEFANKYRTVSPTDFVKYKKGVCWDYANYEYNSPIVKNIPKKAYYIELEDKTSTTHTFVVFNIDDSYVYIEKSYYKCRGIYISKNIGNIFNFVLMNMMNSNDYKYHIREYTPSSSFVGLTTLEFMDKCMESKKVEHKYSKTQTKLEKYTSTNSLNETYDDGLINSDTLNSYNLINGNYAASILMNDDTSDKETEDTNDIEFERIKHDSIKDVKDEVISNFNEYEYNSDQGGVEICTLRNSLRL